jgi:hypothetical protein
MYRAWLQAIVDENISNDQKVLDFRKLGAEFDSSCNWASNEVGEGNRRRSEHASIGNSSAILERPTGFADRSEAQLLGTSSNSTMAPEAVVGDNNFIIDSPRERTRKPTFCFYSGESSKLARIPPSPSRIMRSTFSVIVDTTHLLFLPHFVHFMYSFKCYNCNRNRISEWYDRLPMHRAPGPF